MAATASGPGKDNDPYRKPNPGMWDLVSAMLRPPGQTAREKGDDGPGAQMDFMVGDAAGRSADHSNADRGFAVRAGLTFFLPEDFFIEGGPPVLVTGARPGQGNDMESAKRKAEDSGKDRKERSEQKGDV